MCHVQKTYIPNNPHHFVHIVEKNTFFSELLSFKENFCILGQQVLTKIFTWQKSPNFILQNPSFDFFISYVVPEIFLFFGSSTRSPDFQITTFTCDFLKFESIYTNQWYSIIFIQFYLRLCWKYFIVKPTLPSVLKSCRRPTVLGGSTIAINRNDLHTFLRTPYSRLQLRAYGTNPAENGLKRQICYVYKKLAIQKLLMKLVDFIENFQRRKIDEKCSF